MRWERTTHRRELTKTILQLIMLPISQELGIKAPFGAVRPRRC